MADIFLAAAAAQSQLRASRTNHGVPSLDRLESLIFAAGLFALAALYVAFRTFH